MIVGNKRKGSNRKGHLYNVLQVDPASPHNTAIIHWNRTKRRTRELS